MCGIVGIINKKRSEKVTEPLIKGMRDTLTHRGPDDAGIFIDNNVGLGHRRLSICIVFNGEIYNYKELQSELAAKGHRFVTNSDTEVIVHLYEEYGPDCVKSLRGMFAIAIWDSKCRRLFLARDRVGKKPLYYYKGNDSFVFASEIKAP
jgi:asparagine synthase (glutamine-hydrolysing)